MKISQSIVQICNFHKICQNCSACGPSNRKKKVIISLVYVVLVSLLSVAVYASTTITLHKADIAPQNPSQLSCAAICPSDYKFQDDINRCCTSAAVISCKTKLQCKDWVLQHDRNYLFVAYAYITLFSCIVLVHIFICLRSKCEKDSKGQKSSEKRQILRWRNKHDLNSLEDALFDNELKCEICMKDATPRKAITLSCCKSLVHPKCLQSWMQEIDNCPSCSKIMEPQPSK